MIDVAAVLFCLDAPAVNLNAHMFRAHFFSLYVICFNKQIRSCSICDTEVSVFISSYSQVLKVGLFLMLI